MKVAVMPGTFDPFTDGHLDMLLRACKAFDFVYVAVLVNKNKTCAFTVDERVKMIKEVIESNGMINSDAENFGGLLVDYVKEKNACAIVRGIRTQSDFENEMRMADINATVGGAETVCFFAKPQLASVSSSMVRELAAFGGDISGFVPNCIYNEIKERLCREWKRI